MKHLLRVLALLASLLAPSFASATPPMPVAASFSILADLVHQIGGERVSVTTLVGPDEDAHAFQARPSDARRVKDARLVFANGLGFDNWMERLARAAGVQQLVIASTGIAALHGEDAHDDGHDDHAGHAHGANDPHAWQDPRNVLIYVDNIRAALSAADPAGSDYYDRKTDTYKAALRDLDARIRGAVLKLPADRRRIVTSHDAFGYFAHAYGLDFIAPVGLGNEADPSAAGVAALIRQIRETRVPAVFLENVTDPRLLERIRRETGAKVGGVLYSDALSKRDPAASTYIGMMDRNLATLTAALAPTGTQ